MLVSVNVSGAEAKPTSWLPKLSDPGVSVNPGTPVPVSVAVSVMPADSTFSVALSAPSRLGVNTTVIVQFVPAATAPQPFDVTLKSAAFVPVNTTDDTCAAKLELFVQVKVCGALG